MNLYFSRLILILCLLAGTHGFAQTGNYVVTNYQIDQSRIDYPFFDIQQDSHGILMIASRNGVLRFDGKNWDRIETRGTIFSLLLINDQRVFAGGKAGFGVIELDASNERVFRLLSEDWDQATNIFQIIRHEDHLYALSPVKLFKLDLNGNLVHEISGSGSYPFGGIFIFNNQVHVTQGTDEILQINNDELQIATPNFQGIIPLFDSPHPDGSKRLIGTVDDRLMLWENSQFTEIKVDADEIGGLDVTCGVWLNATTLAIGTITSGVVFIDAATGKIVTVSDNNNGLSDNEVLKLALDRDNGLWVGESLGLDRIAPNLPITRWDNFPGLDGSIITSHDADNTYIGTSQGLFRLTRVAKFRETKYYEDIVTGSTLPEPKENKGFLRFLKKKTADEPQIPKSRRVERIRKELVSTTFEYEALEGTKGEIDNFIIDGSGMISSGLGGVHQIREGEITKILDRPVRSCLLTADRTSLWVNTLDNELIVFSRVGGEWQELETASGFTVTIDFMFEDSDGYLWLNGADMIYRVYLLDRRIAEIFDYGIDNPFFDKTLSFERGGKVYFVNASGYFRYDPELDSVVNDAELQRLLGTPGKYISDPMSNVWVESNSEWYRIYNDTIRREDVLQIFPDIRSVSYVNQHYWIITNRNRLYRFSDEGKDLLVSNHELFLKEIKSSSGKLRPVNFKRIGEDNSSLVFEFVQPDYAGFYGIKYRYQLEGLEQGWSEWSENNRIQFPYLPNGKYRMLVQTIDIFGQINDAQPVEFSVVPPYWRQPWFYLLEVSIFVTLLFLSIRLRNRERFNFLSRVLAFLTLILGVEFVQIVAETYFKTDDTPVIEFFIQVAIAFAILPFESILRRAVLGEKKKEAPDSAS